MGNQVGKLFGKKEARILLQGLDAAGKTTILYQLKLGEVVTTIPTIGFNVETIQHRNVSFTAWDVGGRCKMRALYRHYYQNTQGLIFVVDSNDHERLNEVKEELHQATSEDELRDVILVIFANKQDLPNAMSPAAMAEHLELHKIKQKWHVIPTVATTGEGLTEGLDWLAENLTGVVQPQVDHGNTCGSATGYMDKVWNLVRALFVAESP